VIHRLSDGWTESGMAARFRGYVALSERLVDQALAAG